MYGADGFAYDVYDPDGRLLGTVDSPDRSARFPPYARAGRLYQIATDSLGVQYVRAFRVTGLEGTGRADGDGA